MVLSPFITFFMYPLFVIFGPDGEPITVWITDDIEEQCNHMGSDACYLDHGIITLNPFGFAAKGCTVLNHEYYHILGYAENEIPYCPQPSQEFRIPLGR